MFFGFGGLDPSDGLDGLDGWKSNNLIKLNDPNASSEILQRRPRRGFHRDEINEPNELNA